MFHKHHLRRQQLAQKLDRGEETSNECVLRDIQVTHADAIYLSSKPFWKE